MKLILALGNPGSEYTNSRHNIGFTAIENFASEISAPEFQEKAKFKARLSELNIRGEKIILAMPTTYYNLVGQSARAILDFYNISIEDTLVIHDDMSLDFGTIRIRQAGSDAGNNGIKSLNAHLGENYWRVRVGTKSELTHRISNPDFVLGKLTETERAKLNKEITPEVIRAVTKFIENKIEPTSIQAQVSDPARDAQPKNDRV